MRTSKFNVGGNSVMDLHPIQGGVEILLVASCYRHWDKLRLMNHLACMQTLPIPSDWQFFSNLDFWIKVMVGE